MKIRADQLPTHLAKSQLSCYLISGDEPLLVSEALQAVRDAGRADGYTERDLHIAERGFDWNRLASQSANMSLFAERKLIELRLPTGKPGDKGAKAIIELVTRPPPDTLVLLSAPKLERATLNSKWVKAVDAAGAIVQVWPVDERNLPSWISQRLRAKGLRAERDAIMLLSNRIEGNLLAAQQEIEKLWLLYGEREIGVSEIEASVANSSRFNVFKLVDAAIAGQPRRAVKILGSLRDEGVEPVLVVWAFSRELRTLARMQAQVSDGAALSAVLKDYRVWANRQPAIRAALGRHSLADLRSLLAHAARCDAAVKGRSLQQPWIALLELTTQVSTAVRVPA